MYSTVSVVQPPAVEPVTVAQARAHCRVDSSYDDTLLAMYITAARVLVEQYLNRALITQTLQFTMAQNQPPGIGPFSVTAPIFILPLWFNWADLLTQWIELPRAPLQSVVSVTLGVWDQGTDNQLYAGTDYDVDLTMQPGRILLLNNGNTAVGQNHLGVEYVAGYGDDPSAIPQPICMAVLWIVAFLYENRGDTDAVMPRGAEALLAPYRLVTFG